MSAVQLANAHIGHTPLLSHPGIKRVNININPQQMESDTDSDSEVEERTETTKDHSRRHADISDLIKVSDVKRAFSEVSVDPLRGASDEQLMHVMGANQEWYQHAKDICK